MELWHCRILPALAVYGVHIELQAITPTVQQTTRHRRVVCWTASPVKGEGLCAYSGQFTRNSLICHSVPVLTTVILISAGPFWKVADTVIPTA